MKFIVTIITLLYTLGVFSQEKYWVFLSDKDGAELNPYEYFDAKAIQRRIKHNLPLVEESDKPLRTDYLNTIRSICDTVTGHTRWFNAVACVVSTEEQKSALKNLSFVTQIVPMLSQTQFADNIAFGKLKKGEQQLLESQINWMQGSKFAKAGITGKGIRICIIDAGFPGVDVAKEFEHIRKAKHIIGTWDFHKKQPEVYKFNTHGSTVLSCIAGKAADGTPIGMAPDAEFLLARTERLMKEGLSEEEDWLMAVEWADKNGADIINSSLGYTTSHYFKEDMDGQTALISRAGNLAAHKGILVVNAAGNSGDTYWKYLGAPADADSVLTVGGINPWTGIHTSFSSYGPTADGRRKPNVSAFGHVIGYGNRTGLHETQGTSFSSPLTAGFAACILQYDTNLTVMELFRSIEESANLYPYYDYAHGYGVPLAGNILPQETRAVTPTIALQVVGDEIVATISENSFELNDHVVINYHSQFFKGKSYSNMHIQDSYMSDDSNTKLQQPNYVYYKISDSEGRIKEYSVIAPRMRNVLKIPINEFIGNTLEVNYKGFTTQMKIEAVAQKENLDED